MRFNKFELIRYGKFTDATVPLPSSKHDFHFIVGPNEAGKSTLRAAIRELLYGFPVRSASMAFLHPQPELRLGAEMADGDRQLAFHRTKGNKNTLRTPADVPLADNALEPFLGNSDRDFFEQMFGLDHTRLVEGGQSILNAEDDVSQVLFQSSAGIAGLGKVKDALVTEAEQLWGARATNTKTYHVAHNQFVAAGKELKDWVVNTKVWSEARQALDDVDRRINLAKEHKQAVQGQRTALERVRRLSPTVQALRLNEDELRELAAEGEVLMLPADAAKTVQEAEVKMSVARSLQQQREGDVALLEAQRDGLTYDEALLAAKTDIEALEAFSQRARDHYADLDVRKAELAQFVALAAAAGAELGWPQDEASLRSQLPEPLALREVQRLVTSHGGLLQTRDNAAAAVLVKQEEIAQANRELENISNATVSENLRNALSEAQVHRNAHVTRLKMAGALASANRDFDTALAGLGAWPRDVEELQRMVPPTLAQLTARVSARQALTLGLSGAAEQLRQAEGDLKVARLAVTQFEQSGRIVTREEVQGARQVRDGKWSAIKVGTAALTESAGDLDSAILLADELVDLQLGATAEAAQLQSLRQQTVRAELEVELRRTAHKAKESDLTAADAEWADLATSWGLVGLELEAAAQWFVQRQTVLDGWAAQQSKRDDLEQERDLLAEVAGRLADALTDVGLTADRESPLPLLLAQSETFVTEADTGKTRRQVLVPQVRQAEDLLRGLEAAAQVAEEAYGGWAAAWRQALANARLSAYVNEVDDAEEALLKVAAVRLNLSEAAMTQRDRIDTMNADLQRFERMATALVEQLGLAELSGAEPREVVRATHPRMLAADKAFVARQTAETALATANTQVKAAKEEVERLAAALEPLLRTAGVSTVQEVQPLIERSDRKRALETGVETARKLLVQDSDGLGPAAVLAEVDSCDLGRLTSDLADVGAALDAAQTQLTALAEERLLTNQAFIAIDGGQSAAQAEARRQEALAGMTHASERYVRVTTAVQLLKWAIDKYRDQQQGPMLTRAGAIFASVTLGQYSKLFVDYDKTPVSLSALHKSGRQVEVSGLSEGTRDQLYLALRLAALELHLGRATALPFVADDLFVNFDDDRSTAGLHALRELSAKTQVLFLSHHDHLLTKIQSVFGSEVNVVRLQR